MASSIDLRAEAAGATRPLSPSQRLSGPSPLPAPVWGSSAVQLEEVPAEVTSSEPEVPSPGVVPQASAELESLVEYTLTVIVEVLDGRRPMTQFQRIARRDVASMVDRRRVLAERMRARLSASTLPSSRVLERHSQCPMADVIEVAATVRHAGRVRAVCLRFEQHRAKWQVVHFSMA